MPCFFFEIAPRENKKREKYLLATTKLETYYKECHPRLTGEANMTLAGRTSASSGVSPHTGFLKKTAHRLANKKVLKASYVIILDRFLMPFLFYTSALNV